MALDKDKVAKNALKYIQKGQFEKAIEEYRKVLDSDSRDIRTRLKLIDLYGRTGRTKEAIDQCLEVAESYADQGFYLKAIAVYKQALRIDASNATLYRNMGELYVKQGLVGDALSAFKKGVELLRQQGDAEGAERLLARMEEMAPENAAIKIHLAELYLADGKYKAFEEQLGKIVLQLRGEGRTGKLLQAIEAFYEKSNRYPAVVKRLAELYADLHEEGKALEVVRHGLAQDPRDRDLRLLALRAYLTLGNLAEARRMALGLFEEAPDDLFILEQLAAIAQARGDYGELAHAYKAMAKVYGKQGLSHKEEAYFRKVIELLPEDAEARLALGEMVLEPLPPQELVPEAGEEGFWRQAEVAVPAGSGKIRDGLVETELYLKYGLEAKAEEKLRELIEIAPDNIDLRQKLRDLCQRKGDREGWVREQLRIAELHTSRKKDSDALRAYQAILEVAPDNADAREAVRYLRPDLLPEKPAGFEIDVDGATLEFVHVEGEEKVVYRRAPKEAGGDDEQVRDGLSEVDFFEAQGLKDEAIGALLRLREKCPNSSVVASRLEQLGWAEEDGEAYVNLQEEILNPALPDFAGFRDFEISELDDIVREFRSGIAEKLHEGDYDTHYNLGVAYKEMGLLEDALQEFQVAARSPQKSREAYTSMAMVFRDLGRRQDARAALRMALALPTNAPVDRVAILYEIGVVSEEDQDWEGALRAYSKAAEIDPSYRDLRRRLPAVQARVSA